jgi:hypothetical protein
MAIHEAYMREMYDEYGYFAVWLPSVPLALGDVGTFTGHRFDKLTTLADLGVSFRVSLVRASSTTANWLSRHSRTCLRT